MQIPPTVPPPAASSDAKLRQAAEELETQFLAEMLKTTGLGDAPQGFDGGHGEEHFSSLLVQERARAMVAGGGIGLAESLFNALKGRQDGRN